MSEVQSREASRAAGAEDEHLAGRGGKTAGAEGEHLEGRGGKTAGAEGEHLAGVSESGVSLSNCISGSSAAWRFDIHESPPRVRIYTHARTKRVVPAIIMRESHAFFPSSLSALIRKYYAQTCSPA